MDIPNDPFLYSQRSPKKIMEALVKAVYESEQDKLWHSKLKQIMRDRYWPSLSDSSFRCAKQRLIKEGIIVVKGKPHKKRALILLSEAAQEAYLFGNLPILDTYLSREQAGVSELNMLYRLRKSRRRKEIKDTYSARRERIVRYFLLRAVYGTTYTRKITNKEEQNQAGLIRTYTDSMGHSYSPVDIKASTEKEKKGLVPITLEAIVIPGVAIMDLVYHRDVGCDGYFRYISTTRGECEAIVKDLVRRGILVQISNEEVQHALAGIKHKEAFDPLLSETRYKIATESLARYISDYDTLHYYLVRWIEDTTYTRKNPHRSQKGIDFYAYYVGDKLTNDLRTRLRLEHQEMLKLREEVNNKTAEIPIEKSVALHQEKKRRKELKYWYDLTKEKLREIRENEEYNDLNNEFPILQEVFMKYVTDVLWNTRNK